MNLNLRLKNLNEFNETSEFNDECPNETSHSRAMLLPPIKLLDKVRIIYLVNDPAWLLWNRVKTSGKAL